MEFEYSYDEEWDEITLSLSIGNSTFRLTLVELFDEEDEPLGGYHLLAFSNEGEKGSGLGRKVRKSLLDWVLANGGSYLTTCPGGEYLHNLYKDCGFIPQEDEVSWIASLTS